MPAMDEVVLLPRGYYSLPVLVIVARLRGTASQALSTRLPSVAADFAPLALRAGVRSRYSL